MASSRILILSEGCVCSRHVFGRIGGRTAGTACPGTALCPTAENARTSIIRTLKCKNQLLATRARSVLAANISTGLQGCTPTINFAYQGAHVTVSELARQRTAWLGN